MYTYQLRKTIKLHANFLNYRNISKIKAEHAINTRLLYQLQNQERISSMEIKDDKFPLRNNSQTTNIANPQFISCIHKPLSINLHVTDARNGDRKYLEKYPSVTTILSNTKPSNEFFGLMQWRKTNIEKHGKEKFSLMQRDTTTKGTNFHQEMKLHFSNLNIPPQDTHTRNTSGFFKSVSSILPNISNPLAIESAVVHSQLEYAGTVDLVAEYMGTLSVIDWKTSKKKRDKLKDCHSYPLQLAAYAGAINHDNDYPFQVSNGLLVITYENGDTTDVHILDEDILEEYWEKWLERLHKYKANTSTCIPDTATKTSSDPTNNCTNGPFLPSLEQESKWTTKDHAPLASNEIRTKGLFIDRSQYTTNSSSLNGVVFQSVQDTGRNLSELGRRVKDEEVVATWRTLSGLMESIFGKVLLSKGLLLSHYIKSVFSEVLRIIVSSLCGRRKKE